MTTNFVHVMRSPPPTIVANILPPPSQLFPIANTTDSWWINAYIDLIDIKPSHVREHCSNSKLYNATSVRSVNISGREFTIPWDTHTFQYDPFTIPAFLKQGMHWLLWGYYCVIDGQVLPMKECEERWPASQERLEGVGSVIDDDVVMDDLEDVVSIVDALDDFAELGVVVDSAGVREDPI